MNTVQEKQVNKISGIDFNKMLQKKFHFCIRCKKIINRQRGDGMSLSAGKTFCIPCSEIVKKK